jgi:hypothetical protein
VAKSVYVVQVVLDDEVPGPVKIGTTGDPKARLRKIQWGCPWPVALRAIVRGRDLREITKGSVWEREALLSGRWATAAESVLHARFASSRMQGEWFGCTEALEEFIQVVSEGR